MSSLAHEKQEEIATDKKMPRHAVQDGGDRSGKMHVKHDSALGLDEPRDRVEMNFTRADAD